jgi:putative endonuclease
MKGVLMYYIYILSNKYNNVLYIGITNNLVRRVYEHKNKLAEGFTKRYNVNKLVYYEVTSDAEVAINREKQLKRWRREKKDNLINSINPKWNDLYEEICK